MCSFVDAHMYMCLRLTIWDWIINQEAFYWKRLNLPLSEAGKHSTAPSLSQYNPLLHCKYSS